MLIDDTEIITFSTTPFYLIEAECLHLNKVFNSKPDDDGIKLLPEQKNDELIMTNAFEHMVKTSFKFTNNGIYSATKTIADDVVQIDVHSMLPTFAYNLGLLNNYYKKLFDRKKRIEAIPNYQNNTELVKERNAIKLKLNLYCSTNDSGQGRYVNRLLAVYSSMNFMFDVLNYWGLSNVINCLNDGFIMRVPNNFEDRYLKFKDHYQAEISGLTFSVKKWKHAIIKSPQEYILINSDNDYKCRNHSFDVNSIYQAKTGKSLRKLKSEDVDQNVVELAQAKERRSIKMLNNYLFQEGIDGVDSMDQAEKLNNIKQILGEAGVYDTQYLITRKYYSYFTLDEENNTQGEDYANRFTKEVLRNQVFLSNCRLKDRTNILNQSIKATEVKDIDDYLENTGASVISNYLPSVLDSIGEGQSIEDWLKYEVHKIRQTNVEQVYQYNILALTTQIWASLHHGNANQLGNYLTKLWQSKYLDKLDVADYIYNDPNTLVVDGRLLVKDERGTYSTKESVVNHLLKKYFTKKEKQQFKNNKNNVLALLTDEKYQDQLGDGFQSDHQAIFLDQNAEIRTDSPFRYQLNHHVNVDYDPTIVNSSEYFQLNYFLKHLAPKALKQLKAMLGLIPLQHTDIMAELRVFIVLKGKSGAGKSTLATLLEKNFNDQGQSGSNIRSNTQNVNQAFTNGRHIALNDVKNGKVMLWFDDFQANEKRNIITANAGTVINGVISGMAETASAKYEVDHPVTLPSLIVIATNAMPQVTQEGTAARMFVINSPKSLKEDPIKDEQGRVVKVSDFINNPKVWQALFYIIMQEASKLLKMSDKERQEIFNHKHSAATKLAALNDSLELFLENEGITSLYDLVGIQANRLFNVYKDKMKQSGASYRAFTEQLEMLGFVMKRKHFNGKNYQKVICVTNDKLTQDKIKAMFKELHVTPDQLGSVDQTTGEITTLKTWRYKYDEFKKKYPQSNAVFTPFEFNN
ncbi:hypothetical protein H5S09_03840 [Limosilactobacillus sp. STM2_1]|uniref:SF3 helicase domain-containing protein n=1 Tax=Limosilactobacillus rudii TaxID=2759755 RepID=A0A7W3UK50_9LACO|nr:hypothetical protein [Limosilactobacillus rudii]MBB1079190.1 hypothetical protein [Limosilactobacillus rudii]MBB1097084.1 hypothetical protein [Limosilactobacillus rudii]MCD7134337.1 adenylyl-sulfate kinase [Limosilactobacillus rudii]